jgi:hypothetical protein
MLDLIPLQNLIHFNFNVKARSEEKLIRINNYYYHQPTHPGPSLFNEKCEVARLIKIRFGQLSTRHEISTFSYGLRAHDRYYAWFQNTYPHVNAMFELLLIYGRISAVVDMMYQDGNGWVIVEIKSSPWRAEPSWVKQLATYTYIMKELGFNVTGAQLVTKNLVINYDSLSIPFLIQSGQAGYDYLHTLPEKGFEDVEPNYERCTTCMYARLCPRKKTQPILTLIA